MRELNVVQLNPIIKTQLFASLLESKAAILVLKAIVL